MQEELVSAGGGVVLGLEHPYVITLGRRSRRDPEVPQGPIQWVERGGEATIHSPGQLVIYPVVAIGRWGARCWVEHLLKVTENTLQHLGLSTRRDPLAGLWTEAGKIAFLGLQIRRGVSSHGLSINVSNDLGLFSGIKACGHRGVPLDSLERRGVTISCRDLFAQWMGEYRKLASGSACQGQDSSV